MAVDLTPEQWLKRLEVAHKLELSELQNLDNHFQGTQPLNYLHPELLRELEGRLQQVVINWPELVVDCLDERLDVEGFRVSGQAKDDAGLGEIWQYNNLDEWSQQGHVEALVMRRAYTIVGANPMRDEPPLITVESPLEMHAELDPRTRQILAAAKWWEEKDAAGKTFQHATLYLPNETIWYVKQSGEWIEDQDYERDLHELGTPPVSLLVNRPRLRCPLGKSELDSIMPISNAANKIATDMMVSAEFHAMPRRWALGFGPEDFVDENGNKVSSWSTVVGKLWATEKSRLEGAEVGQFPETDLQNFHKTLDLLARVVGSLGALPPSFMGFATDNPASADAMRSSENRLIKRAERRQGGFGGGHERSMRIAHRIFTGEWRPDLRRLQTRWRDPSTPTIAQSADAAVKLYTTSPTPIIPLRQTRERLRFSDEEIAVMEAEDEKQAAAEVARVFGPPKPEVPVAPENSVPGAA